MTKEHRVICSIIGFIFVLLSSFLLVTNDVFGEGWAGSGSSSGSSSFNPNPGYGDGMGNWAVSDTGVSWAFYEATDKTDDWTEFPYPYNGAAGRVTSTNTGNGTRSGAQVPGECSQHTDQHGGVWHLGYNSMGAGYFGVGGWIQGRASGDIDSCGSVTAGMYGTRCFYGHWATLSWGNASRATYKTSISSGSPKQKVGVYQFTKTGSWWDVLSDYNEYLRSIGEGPVDGFPNDLFAFCYWDGMGAHKFIAYAVEPNGTYLNNGNPIDQVEASNGAAARVHNKTFTGYDFKGWRWDRYSGQAYRPNDDSFEEKNLIEDKVIYAVYEKKKVTLTGKAADSKGKLIPSIEDVSSTVWYNNSASVTRRASDVYTFLGWKAASSPALTVSAGFASKGETYTKNNLTSNSTIYAIYQINRRKLTAYAIDTNGNDLKNTAIDSKEVDYGSKAAVDMEAIAGYTFKGWRLNKTSGAVSGNGTYTVNSLTRDTIVYAVYERNSFLGRARVFEGSGTSGSYYKNTGFVDDSKTAETLKIKCPNNGCNATFDLALQRKAGESTTEYTVSYSINNVVTKLPKASITPVSPVLPSTSGTILKISGKSYVTFSLKPGDFVCYSLEFRPYGRFGNTVKKEVKTCAQAEVTSFEGKSEVNSVPSGLYGTTGWSKVNKTQIVKIANCSAENGCKVVFSHRLKANPDNGGSTKYRVFRESNLEKKDSGRGIDKTGPVKGETVFSGADKEVFKSEEITLYPGMVVCESLYFVPNNKTTSEVSTKVCASATGDAQPNDPPNPDEPEDPEKLSGDTSFLNIKVRNSDVEKYNKYQREVYAKPGDTLDYRSTYNPVLQYTYSLKPEKMQIDGGTEYPKDAKNKNDNLGKMFNAYKPSDMKGWNNGFTTFINENTSRREYVYQLGDYSVKYENPDSHVVQQNEVGTSVDRIVKTNDDVMTESTKDVRTTPSQVSFSLVASSYNKGNVITEPKDKTAHARVPYNFKSKIEVPDENEEFPVLPVGEEATKTFTVTPLPKCNAVTMNGCEKDEDGYVTLIPEAERRVIVYNPDAREGSIKESPVDFPVNGTSSKNEDLCARYFGIENNEVDCGYAYLDKSSGDINSQSSKIQATFYTKDRKAGSRVCIAAAVYPSTSGSDTNWEDKEGDHRWRISESRCYTLAKKPSLQAWGGNVYSAIPISTNVSNKNNVDHYTEGYSVSRRNAETYVFGSFGEYGVIANGSVKGFASGAGTGFDKNDAPEDSRGLWPSTYYDYRDPVLGPGNNSRFAFGGPGGSKERANNVSFCNRTSLSFPNNGCETTGVKNALGLRTNTENNKRDKESVISKIINGESFVVPDGEAIGGEEISGGIKAYRGEGSIIINGNISYVGSFESLSAVPKMVIYAKKDIIINCDVTRIDALLIADHKVKTCDSDDINSKKNSEQLVINGAVIANNLIANRTYGAATGANSIIPAEILNFDPTLYLWGSANMDGSSNDINLDVTYIQEMAPRY